MRQENFEIWLRSIHLTAKGAHMQDGAISTRVANCKRVEKYEGNLDVHLATDSAAQLLERLNFSAKEKVPKHRIPIDGNLYKGSATLKTAVNLYKQFHEAWPPEAQSQPLATLRQVVGDSSPIISPGAWPKWAQPTDSEALTLAKVVIPYVRFLNPDIIAAIVHDNELRREEWSKALDIRGIKSEAYLWERGACAFPGVRRYAGSEEIARYRGHGKNEDITLCQALRLDDNDCPKQIWSFTFRFKPFQKQGPKGYALAHLADHKSHGNRFGLDFDVAEERDESDLFGLYSCPTNTVFIPTSMIKPTDFGGPLRNLLMRRAEQLYGKHCQLLPDWLHVRPSQSPAWEIEEFKWGEPVGGTEGVQAFLEYRRKMLSKLFGAKQE